MHSARKACKLVFGEGEKNVNKTVGKKYKSMFGDSIGNAKNLNRKERERRLLIIKEGVVLSRPGNPNFQPYLTPDEDDMVACLLATCSYMHMPFDRVCFRGLIVSIAEVVVVVVVALAAVYTTSHNIHHTISQANGHKNASACDYYVRQFMDRHPELGEFKMSNVSVKRAKQATTEIRDAVFGKLQVYIYTSEQWVGE